jgi:hypothetical protein
LLADCRQASANRLSTGWLNRANEKGPAEAEPLNSWWLGLYRITDASVPDTPNLLSAVPMAMASYLIRVSRYSRL